MGFGFRNFWNGLRLKPNSSNTTSQKGDLQVTNGDSRLLYHDGSVSQPVVTISSIDEGASRLQNKELDDSSCAVVDNSDTSKKIKFDAEGTTGTTTTIQSSQTTNRTLTLPDETSTLSTQTGTETLTNKTLISPTITGGSISPTSLTIPDNSFTLENSGDNTRQLQFDISNISTSTTRTLSVPNANTTIVGNDSTQTLTNKTISISSNSITGPANQVVIINGSGVETTEANLAISRGGTAAGNKTNGFDNLSPLNSVGDLIGYNGSHNVRLPVGSDTQVLTADSSQPTGWKWANAGGAIPPTSTKLFGGYTYVGTLFIVSGASADVGAVYHDQANPGDQYTVVRTISGENYLFTTSSTQPAVTGTLILDSGSGDASIPWTNRTPLGQYTTPISPIPLYLKVRVVGGGGGGAGSSAAIGDGQAGQDGFASSFEFSVAEGGKGAGNGPSFVPGGDGGIAAPNDGFTNAFGFNGGGGASGGIANQPNVYMQGGLGGSSVFGGSGKVGALNGADGGQGAPGSGAGGAGASGPVYTGGGGGSGAYVEIILPNPDPSYYFAVGLGGMGGLPGTSGNQGGHGASGGVIVEEFYQ